MAFLKIYKWDGIDIRLGVCILLAVGLEGLGVEEAWGTFSAYFEVFF